MERTKKGGRGRKRHEKADRNSVDLYCTVDPGTARGLEDTMNMDLFRLVGDFVRSGQLLEGCLLLIGEALPCGRVIRLKNRVRALGL